MEQDNGLSSSLLGFTPLHSESCIYYQILNGDIVIATIHVDDFLSIASSMAANQAFKDQI